MKCSIKDFFCICNQIRRELWRGCSSDIATSYYFHPSNDVSMLYHGSVVANLKQNKRNLTQTLTLNVLLPSIVFLNKI